VQINCPLIAIQGLLVDTEQVDKVVASYPGGYVLYLALRVQDYLLLRHSPETSKSKCNTSEVIFRSNSSPKVLSSSGYEPTQLVSRRSSHQLVHRRQWRAGLFRYATIRVGSPKGSLYQASRRKQGRLGGVGMCLNPLLLGMSRLCELGKSMKWVIACSGWLPPSHG
jgi:hypothetical protein